MCRKIELCYCWKHGSVKNKNKLVEWKAFVDTVGIKSAELKDKFLFYRLPNWLYVRKDFGLSNDWFGCVFIFPFWVTKMFSESLAWSSSCFAHIYLFATRASYAINDITWCYDKFFVSTSWISNCKYLTNETARINSPQTWVSNTFIRWIWYWWNSASLASLQSWNT